MPSGPAGVAPAQGAPARPPRRLGQVVLGAVMVVGTAALIVHAEILSSERDADLSRPPRGAHSAQTASTARRAPAAPPRGHPPAHPRAPAPRAPAPGCLGRAPPHRPLARRAAPGAHPGRQARRRRARVADPPRAAVP